MRRGYAVGLAVLMVAVNAGAYWYVRNRMLDAQPAPSTRTQTTGRDTPADEDVISGLLELAGAADGSVLRLTKGSCEDAETAVAWIAGPGGQPDRIEVTGLVQTLAAGAIEGTWWVVGAHEDCSVAAWRSRDLSGAKWEEGGVPAGVWFPDPKVPQQIRSAKADVALAPGCAAAVVETVGRNAAVVCEDGRGLSVTRAGEVTELPVHGLASLAVSGDGRLAALVEGEACVAEARVMRGTRSLEPAHCFGNDKAPLGIAFAGGAPVAQIGYSLYDDVGGEWAQRK